MSRRELADALGVHYQTVGYLERGEYSPSLHLALRIAAYFDVPVEFAFSDRAVPVAPAGPAGGVKAQSNGRSGASSSSQARTTTSRRSHSSRVSSVACPRSFANTVSRCAARSSSRISRLIS